MFPQPGAFRALPTVDAPCRAGGKKGDGPGNKTAETNAAVTGVGKEIADLGRRCTEPLRQKPERRSLFTELESDAA